MLIVDKSIEAAKQFENKSVDFVFIDAAHEYEDVQNDIEAWLPKIKTGGIIAGHDYIPTYPGVMRAVNEKFGDKVDKRYEYEGCWLVNINKDG
jgi:predicted O-methyltransferase YrrM